MTTLDAEERLMARVRLASLTLEWAEHIVRDTGRFLGEGFEETARYLDANCADVLAETRAELDVITEDKGLDADVAIGTGREAT